MVGAIAKRSCLEEAPDLTDAHEESKERQEAVMDFSVSLTG